MLIFKAIFYTSVSMASGVTLAGQTAYPCDNCSETSYRVAAVNKARSLTQGNGYIYIFDNTHALLRKYEIEREPGQNGTFTYYATAVTPTASEANDFSSMNRFYALSGRSMKDTYTIDPSHPAPGSPPFPTQVSDYISNLNNNYGYYGINVSTSQQNYMTTYITNYLNNLEGTNFDPSVSAAWDYAQVKEQVGAMEYTGVQSIGLTISVKVPNSGPAVITFDLVPHTSPAKWKITKMIDKNNNTVPLKAEDAFNPNGNTSLYDFNNFHTDIASFEYYLQHGLNIPTFHYGGWTIACVGIPGSRTCSAQPN